MQLLLILLLVFHLGLINCSREWLDPHEMHSDYATIKSEQKNNKQWVDPHEIPIDLNKVYNKKEQIKQDAPEGYCSQDTEPNQSHVYLKRLINLLLNSAAIDTEMGLPVYTGTIDLNILEEEYNFLKDFADSYNEECVITLQKVDMILSKSLAKNVYKEYADFFSYLGERLYDIIFNRITISLTIIFLTGLLIYKIIKANFSFWLIMKCLILIAYIIDFATTYLHLIEAEEIKNIVDIKKVSHMPPECDPSKMSWLNYISYTFKSESDCLQYYKATHQNLFYLVTPLKVFSHQFGVLVVGPISYLGAALGAFINQILTELPWGLGYLLLPFVLVFFCLLVMILCVSLLGSSIKFRIFPFVSFEFGNGKQSNTDTLSGSNLENLLHTHRKFVEDVKETTITSQKEPNDSKLKNKKLELEEKKKQRNKCKLGLEQKKADDCNKNYMKNNKENVKPNQMSDSLEESPTLSITQIHSSIEESPKTSSGQMHSSVEELSKPTKKHVSFKDLPEPPDSFGKNENNCPLPQQGHISFKDSPELQDNFKKDENNSNNDSQVSQEDF